MDVHPTRPPKGRPSVLIVSRASLAQELAHSVLGSPSVERAQVEDAEAVAPAVRAGRPRLVLIDAQSVGSPAALVHRLRSAPDTRDASIAVLAASRSVPAEEDACRRAGANAVLARPLDHALWDTRLLRFLSVPPRKELRTPVRLQAWGAPGEPSLAGTSVNVSAAGMLVETPVPVALGTRMDLEFELPMAGSFRLLAQAVRSSSRGSTSQAGVEFLAVPDSARRALETYAGQGVARPDAGPAAAGLAEGWEDELRASEARRAALLEAAPDAVVTLDAEGRLIDVNWRAEALFGFARAEMLGRLGWDLLGPPRLRSRLQLRFTRGTPPPQLAQSRTSEALALRADGETVPVEITAARAFVQGRPYVTTFVRDLREGKRSSRGAALEERLRRILRRPGDERSVLASALREVAEALRVELATWWAIDTAGQVLRASLTHHGRGGPFPHVESASRESALALGVDLPGRAWAARAPVVVASLQRDASFARYAAAHWAGFVSALAIPVSSGTELLGVVECFSREPLRNDPGLERRLARLGRTLAVLMARTGYAG